MFTRSSSFLITVGLLSSSCFSSHRALVETSALPPPPDPVVRHSRRLWVELEPGVGSSQCVEPQRSRPLCFDEVDRALAEALSRALWTSFPGVYELGFSDRPEPGDYLLKVDLRLDAVPPNAGGPGWAAVAKGRWQLIRDGRVLAGESVESRSRADFAYGRPLGTGAGEVVDAVALHVGVVLGSVPESAPDRPVLLPPVSAQPFAPAAPRLVAGR